MCADGGTDAVGIAAYTDGFAMPTAALGYADVRVADGAMPTVAVSIGLCRRPWAVGNVAYSGSDGASLDVEEV